MFVTLRKDESFWIELEREDCVFFFILANYEKEAEERIEKQVLWGALFEEQGISFYGELISLWNLMCNRRQVPRQLGDKSGRDGVCDPS